MSASQPAKPKGNNPRCKPRSIWWSITAYQGDIETLKQCQADPKKMPEWLKQVLGGEETCPTTGRLHFQGALGCFNTVRFKRIQDWLPKSHIESAIAKEALKRYAMKPETAVGAKVEATSQRTYINTQEACMMLARQPGERDGDPVMDYAARVCCVLLLAPEHATYFKDSQLRRFWRDSRSVWFHHADTERLAPPPPAGEAGAQAPALEGISITPPASQPPRIEHVRVDSSPVSFCQCDGETDAGDGVCAICNLPV